MLSRGLKRLRLPLLIIVLCAMPTLVHAVVVPSLSGWVYMPREAPDFGYSLEEDDLVYFYSFDFVQSLNTTTGDWFSQHMPIGWVYFDWPLYYELDIGILWFAWPPAGGIGVYHVGSDYWEVLPQIIP